MFHLGHDVGFYWMLLSWMSVMCLNMTGQARGINVLQQPTSTAPDAGAASHVGGDTATSISITVKDIDGTFNFCMS